MITNISRGYGGGAHAGGYATQPPPRIARAVAHSVSMNRAGGYVVPARHGAPARTALVKLALSLVLFALLNAGDLVSTYAGLHSGMREGNPLMSGLLVQYGFAALIVYKAVVIVAVSVGVYLLRTFSKVIATATIWVCNVLVCAVVVMNILQFVTR